MSGRLSNAASRLFGGGGIIAQSVAFSPTRSGMGLPVGKHIVPDSPYEALAWLCGGLGFFASIGVLAVWNNKASKIPFAPKVYPYDNLRVELGGEP